ncbi:MAG TPA: hypothetical protein VF746_13025 [Longimicrobium sp.]|jgi:pimeloyl-ACP methyl ester carboxylesterase
MRPTADPPILAPRSALRPAPGVIEAVVQTGAVETRYRRAGSGAPVLLLAGEGAQPLLASLLCELAMRFRVIAPEPWRARNGDAPPLATSAWLRDVIDGLGLARPSLVADESFGVAALHFALTDPARVGRLALVRSGAADPALDDGGIGDALLHSGHPILLLHAGPDGAPPGIGAAAGDRLVRFLAGEVEGR